MSLDLTFLNTLKAEWDALQPLAPERERRLWKKLRLEWNYHSNHIEGNTLTYGETELLLLHGQAAGDHALREYEEMKAHDVGIEHLRLLAADRARPLSDGDIRDLNRIILKEPFWKKARTADGQPTRARITPGQYKTRANNVITATGEIFEFASPDETAPRIRELVRFVDENLAGGSLHPIELAARVHHEFVLIHPFEDGNGRVARLLMNYVLLRNGFPPVVISSERKPAYLTALRKADAGEPETLTEFLAAFLEASLRLGIRAAKGEAIEELSDVEKEVALFVRTQLAEKSDAALPSRETVAQIMELTLKPFIEKVEVRLVKLAPLFQRLYVEIEDGGGSVTSSMNEVDYKQFQFVGPGQQMLINFNFEDYVGEAPTPFDIQTEIGLHFPSSHYTITYGGELISYPYSRPILGEDADALAAKILASTFAQIKAKAGHVE